MPPALPPTLKNWLRDSSHCEVPAEWVPGLTQSERKAVQAVGGIAQSLLTNAQVAGLPHDVKRWMGSAAVPPDEVIGAYRSELLANPDEAFANLYSAMVSREHRRQLGTFFTPSAEVKLMLDLWTETEGTSPRAVIDVGAGVGVFTAEAAKRWPEAHVVAVDINPVTLGLLAVRLFSEAAADDAPDFARRVQLVCQDYTEWFVSEDAPEEGGRLIIGNPPYTRAQLMTLPERDRLRQLTNHMCGSRASLSAIITALTLQRLGPSDGLSLLLPAQWLESQYARGLREALWNATHRRVELRLIESEDLFGGAQVDAVALLVGAERASPQSFRIGRWRDSDPVQLDRVAEMPSSWRPLFDNIAAPGMPSEQHLSVPLSDLAAVYRGVATGANATFVLSTEDCAEIPKEARTRVITRLGDLPETLDEESIGAVPGRSAGWLLTVTNAQVTANEKLRKWIETAETANIHKRVLCARRTNWFDLTAEVRRPDIVIGAMTQNNFKLVVNGARATITNNLYGITWRTHVTDAQRATILVWLRSDEGQSSLTSVARRQGAGLLKLEPGGLRSLRVPIEIAGGPYGTADGAPGSEALVGKLTNDSVQPPLSSAGRYRSSSETRHQPRIETACS